MELESTIPNTPYTSDGILPVSRPLTLKEKIISLTSKGGFWEFQALKGRIHNTFPDSRYQDQSFRITLGQLVKSADLMRPMKNVYVHPEVLTQKEKTAIQEFKYNFVKAYGFKQSKTYVPVQEIQKRVYMASAVSYSFREIEDELNNYFIPNGLVSKHHKDALYNWIGTIDQANKFIKYFEEKAQKN